MGPAELIEYVKETYGAAPEYLWPDYPDTFVFRHASNRKWFGVVMEVERGKLGLSGPGRVWLLDLKTGPLLGGSYLGQPGVVRAWHMNKTHWLGVLLDGSAPEQTLRELLDLSFSLTEGRAQKHGTKSNSRKSAAAIGPGNRKE